MFNIFLKSFVPWKKLSLCTCSPPNFLIGWTVFYRLVNSLRKLLDVIPINLGFLIQKGHFAHLECKFLSTVLNLKDLVHFGIAKSVPKNDWNFKNSWTKIKWHQLVTTSLVYMTIFLGLGMKYKIWCLMLLVFLVMWMGIKSTNWLLPNWKKFLVLWKVASQFCEEMS